MKKKIIITSLMMASVLPFIGGMETARADEGQNQSVKAKSDLDQAREKLEAAQVKKTQLEEELKKAQDAAKGKEAEIKKEREKIEQAEADIKEDEEILAKDQEIKELDKKIEELRQREKEVNEELEAATQTYKNAQEALDNETKNPGSTENLTSKQKADDLGKQYKIAEDHHGNDQTKKKALEKELENLENELYKVYGQKMGLEEFFKEFEANPAHINIRNTPEYLEFKDKAIDEARTIEDKYKNIEKEIEKKKQEIKENQDRLEKSEANRNEENKPYVKEDLLNEYEKKYNKGIIKDEDLERIENEKVEELKKVTKDLEENTIERNNAIKKLKELRLKEAEQQKELEKSSALAKWLNEKAADNNDAFAKANSELLRKIAQGHEERKKIIIQDRNKNKEPNEILKSGLEYKIGGQYTASISAVDTYTKSVEAIKEFRRFIEAKKIGKAKARDIILESLQEKLAQADQDLKKKQEKLEAIGKEGQALLNKKNEIDDQIRSRLQSAKDKVQSKKAEIENIKKAIKDIEESQELKNLRATNYQIKALDLQIKELQRQINTLENARKQKDSDRPDRGIGDMGIGNVSDDLDIDLSKLNLEKMDKKTRLKNSYLKLKASVNRAKEVVTLAENYAKTGKMDANKRAKLVKLIEKLKVNIGLVEKYLAKLEASL